MTQAREERPAVEGVRSTSVVVRVVGCLVVVCGTALLNRAAGGFQVAPGVALIFPAAGVTVAGALLLGWPGVISAFVGYVLWSWGAVDDWVTRVLFAAVAALMGAVPLLAPLRAVGHTSARLSRFLIYAVLLNTGVSSMIGVPLVIRFSERPFSHDQAVLALASWFAGDAAAVLVVAVPIVLLAAPSLLLDENGRRMVATWGAQWRLHAAYVCWMALVVAGMELLVPTQMVSIHWLGVLLIAAVLPSAGLGGVGAGLLANSLAGVLYVGEVLRLVRPHEGRPLFESVFSSYVNLMLGAVAGIVAGLYAERSRRLVRELQVHRNRLQADFENVVTALAAAIEAKDPTTQGHVQRVARLSVRVGRRLGLHGERLELLRYAAILHDVGKIGIPEQILNKGEPLSPAEREVIERHVDLGVDILERVEILAPAVPFIRYHQERWDGRTKGLTYPGYHGLSGEDIPLEARIIATVDAYDAMTHDRPYRDAMGRSEALNELRRESGRQFDPDVVAAVAAVVNENRLEESSSRWPVLGKVKNGWLGA